jgi:protein-S-isoprenylcysteine O-methyltransferase Ste14
MSDHLKGWILVGLQVACLVWIFGSFGQIPPAWPGKIMASTGLLLGFWALLQMPRSSFSVHPLPKKEGRLQTQGPYRFLRHPMYTAVLLTCMGWLHNRGGITNLLALMLLTSVFLIKIKLEEQYLSSKFGDYKVYQQKTKRLIPWVW